jgi:hypothetical protein
MLEYARWKYILVAAVLVLGLLFASPNFFGSDPALQIARKDHAAITDGSSKEGVLRSKLYRQRSPDGAFQWRCRPVGR